MAPQGRLINISFHSLEDRFGQTFYEKAEQKVTIFRGLPLTEDQIERNQKLKIIGKNNCQVNRKLLSIAVLEVRYYVLQRGYYDFNRYDRYPLWRIIVDDIFQANKTVML